MVEKISSVLYFQLIKFPSVEAKEDLAKIPALELWMKC